MKKIISVIALVVAASSASATTGYTLPLTGNNVSCTTYGNTTNCMRY